MEFERLVSSLDADALADAAAALLEILARENGLPRQSADWLAMTKKTVVGAGSFSPFLAETGNGSLRRSADRRAMTETMDADAAASFPMPKSGPGGDAEAEIAQLAERLAEVSSANRRALSAADAENAVSGASAGAGAFAPFPATGPSASGSGAERKNGGADVETSPPGGGATERAYSDVAESLSEFFRRDSRRYDSGFGE